MAEPQTTLGRRAGSVPCAHRRRRRREMMKDRLIESRLTPNAISITGLILNIVAAVLVWQELYIVGGIAFIVGSVCDTLDGRYSRMSGKGTQFGAFLDSTLDRIEEGIVLTAVAAVLRHEGDEVAAAAAVLAVLASLMVSYTRARAEALGRRVQGRDRSRAVRVVILAIGILFADPRDAARAGGLRARGPRQHHGPAAHLARSLGTPRERADRLTCNARTRRRTSGATWLIDLEASDLASNGNGNGHAVATEARPPTAAPATSTRRSASRSSVSATAPTSFVQGVHYYADADPTQPVPA